MTNDKSKLEIFDIAKERVKSSDPAPILSALGIPYQTLNNGKRYKFPAIWRGERTPSAMISLYSNGFWSFADFGSGERPGSVIDIVMLATGSDFKSALSFCLDQINENELAQRVLGESSEQRVDKYREWKERARKIRERNLEKVQAGKGVLSKVVSEAAIDERTAPMAVEFLRSRGITKIPPSIKFITGIQEYSDGTKKKRFGVGVRTKGGGADIHYLKKTPSGQKSTMIGEPGITVIPKWSDLGKELDGESLSSSPIVIFESKMDYAAAYQKFKLWDYNVLIANSSSNWREICSYIRENGWRGEVAFMNQNDEPGYRFVLNTGEDLGIKKAIYLKYNNPHEYGMDVNDLLLDNVEIAARFKKGTMEDVEAELEVAEKIKRNLAEEQRSKDPARGNDGQRPAPKKSPSGRMKPSQNSERV